jgi:hypothetical protein
VGREIEDMGAMKSEQLARSMKLRQALAPSSSSLLSKGRDSRLNRLEDYYIQSRIISIEDLISDDNAPNPSLPSLD